MKGHKEEVKSAAEYDVLYSRGVYCYLVNHSPVHKIKQQMSRRSRHKENIEVKMLSRLL